MLFGTTFTHFCSKLKIYIFRPNNFKLLFLKKRFPNFVYDFSDHITNSSGTQKSVRNKTLPKSFYNEKCYRNLSIIKSITNHYIISIVQSLSSHITILPGHISITVLANSVAGSNEFRCCSMSGVNTCC